MAETLTEREPGQEQGPEPAPSYSALAEKVAPLREERAKGRERLERSLTEEAASVNPKLKAAQEAGQRLIKEAEERYKAVGVAGDVVQATQAAQPSRKLTEFLAPLKGESPESSIAKFTQALGIFGAAIAGSTKGDARAGLAALTGAMRGWQQGDKERADRHFADWRAKMDAALLASEDERRSYREWFTNANLTVDQMFKGAEMEARMRGNDRMADLFRDKGLSSDIDSMSRELFEWQKHEDTVRLREATLVNAKAIQDQRLAEQQRHNLEQEASRREALQLQRAVLALKEKGADDKGKAKEAAYTLLDQLDRLIPEMEAKGFLATSPDAAAVAMAGARRSRWIPGIGKPGDPTLAAWLVHAGTMVAIQRQLGDIGPRAIAAYQSAIEIVDKATTGAGARAAFANLREALDSAGGGSRPPGPAAPGTAAAGTKPDFVYNPATGRLDPAK